MVEAIHKSLLQSTIFESLKRISTAHNQMLCHFLQKVKIPMLDIKYIVETWVLWDTLITMFG